MCPVSAATTRRSADREAPRTKGAFFPARSPLPSLERVREGRRLPRVPAPLIGRGRDALARARRQGRAPSRAGAARFEQRLLDRISMGWTLFEEEQLHEIGWKEYLERQLHPDEIDDFGLEDAITEALPTTRMTPGEIVGTYGDELQVPYLELLLATAYRAIYSPRQLFERMVVFWSDHFNIDLGADFAPYFKPSDDRDVVRRHALGTFPDLLRASARSPAMLDYLTNASNVAGHPNENYARELMELHTLGVDGGYTETDVKEVARCLTGWAFLPFEAGLEFGSFHFARSRHDTGAKTVLGTAIPAGGGIEDGETVLELLAEHPSTATFVSRKLVRWFQGYVPDERTVVRVAEVYLETGGDIRSMIRETLRWTDLAKVAPKLKRPWHLITSTVRALFAELREPELVLYSAYVAGQLPFHWAPPNGYPDSDGYWAPQLLPRWNWAGLVPFADEALAVDLPFLDPGLPPGELVARLDLLLLGGTMTESTRSRVTAFLAGGDGPLRLRDTVGLVLASPDFQSY